MTNQEQNNFLPIILIRRLLLQTRIQITCFIILYFAFTQLMKFKQSLITLRSRTMSQPNRPVIYTGQVPSYSGENQNIRNLNNVFRIRGPHSSNSDPLEFLKKKQNNIQKTTSVSSEEQKLKEEIKKLKMKQEKCEAKQDELSEKYENYLGRSQEALLRGDEKIINYYELNKQQCVRLIQENGKMMDRIIADRRELEKKLQKLQAQKI